MPTARAYGASRTATAWRAPSSHSLERGGRLGVEPSDGVSGASVGGRPIRLYLGCDETDGGSSTAQTLAEARRLVEQVGVDILIAPTNTLDELALQEYARMHPHTTFVDGAGAAPNPNPAPNFFKFDTNGAQWMAGLGAYAYHTLGWRRAVTVVSAQSDAFFWAQLAAFDAEFCSLGGTIAKRVWYPPSLTDYSTVVAQVPSHGVDGVVVDFPSVLLALAERRPATAWQPRSQGGPHLGRAATEPLPARRACGRDRRCRPDSPAAGSRRPARPRPKRPIPDRVHPRVSEDPEVPEGHLRRSVLRRDDGDTAGARAGARRPLGRREALHGRPRKGDPRRTERADLARLEASRDWAQLRLEAAGPEAEAGRDPDDPARRRELRRLLQGDGSAAERVDAGLCEAHAAALGTLISPP